MCLFVMYFTMFVHLIIVLYPLGAVNETSKPTQSKDTAVYVVSVPVDQTKPNDHRNVHDFLLNNPGISKFDKKSMNFSNCYLVTEPSALVRLALDQFFRYYFLHVRLM